MRVLYRTDDNPIATVFVAQSEDGKMCEFVESTQPPLSRKEKWVLIVSTLFGCPVGCRICDAGGNYEGKLDYEQIMFQIDYLLKLRFQGRNIDTDKFKIQFARMGEPALNDNVLRVLETLPDRYRFKNFIPSVSTVAPSGREDFFERLLDLREKRYPFKFQLQFSIHSTNGDVRDHLIPVRKWDLQTIADYGNAFYFEGGMKIALNFALSETGEVDPGILHRFFDPRIFLIKITPVNPTFKAMENNLTSHIKPDSAGLSLVTDLKKAGYDVLLSIGEWEENRIGSNCGQYITALRDKRQAPDGSYEYKLNRIT